MWLMLLSLLSSAAPPQAPPLLDEPRVSELVQLSLDCVDRPFPNKPGHLLDAPQALALPQTVTPTFYGCYDWHSAVHGHWSMAAVLRRYPQLPQAAALRASLDRHLAPEPLAAELAFFALPRNASFERPYGWGWLLRLSAELHEWPEPDAQRWASNLDPLARELAGRMSVYLDRLSMPIRDGTHQNTAFALDHALDYALTVHDALLEGKILARAREFYLEDRDCPIAWEPSGEDFLSPCLAEAHLMRRALDPQEFRRWLPRFLPSLQGLRPPEIRDLADPRIGHLIGLSLHRAWCLRGLAESEAPFARRHARAWLDLAVEHERAALSQMADSGYGGEHWLASFVFYDLLKDPARSGR